MCHRCPPYSKSLRQLQIIQSPIHRQLPEHDQLRDTQQRPTLRRRQKTGDVLRESLSRSERFTGIDQQLFVFVVRRHGIHPTVFTWRRRGTGLTEVMVERTVGGFVEFFGVGGFVGGCGIGFGWVGGWFDHE